MVERIKLIFKMLEISFLGGHDDTFGGVMVMNFAFKWNYWGGKAFRFLLFTYLF